MISLIGIEYGRGATAAAVIQGPALAPDIVRQMYPNNDWINVKAAPYDANLFNKDRFGENFLIQKKIVKETPDNIHIMIGGDHSVNFGHFTALANKLIKEDLCLIYIDAHLDIHTPESSKAEASGSPHGTNVRALLGDGDDRWLTLATKFPALQPENLFYLGIRSYEPSEIKFIKENNIYMRGAHELQTMDSCKIAANEIMRKIGKRKYVVSFDFDVIDPNIFKDVLVPEADGINTEAAEYFVRTFAPNAYSFEFVEYSPTGDEVSAQIVKKLIGIVLNDA